jgi:hypothetical protein
MVPLVASPHHQSASRLSEDIVSVIDDKTFSVADSESGLRHYLSR